MVLLRSRRVVWAAWIILCACTPVYSQSTHSLTAAEAAKHVGKTSTVCGLVASAHFAATSRGRPTFLNLDEPYPRQIFTVLIWGSDRFRFGIPEKTYSNKRICVTGAIASYRGTPEIIANAPSQIRVTNE